MTKFRQRLAMLSKAKALIAWKKDPQTIKKRNSWRVLHSTVKIFHI